MVKENMEHLNSGGSAPCSHLSWYPPDGWLTDAVRTDYFVVTCFIKKLQEYEIF